MTRKMKKSYLDENALEFEKDYARRTLRVHIDSEEILKVEKPVLGTFSYEGKATELHEGTAAEVTAEINKADLICCTDYCTAELARSIHDSSVIEIKRATGSLGTTSSRFDCSKPNEQNFPKPRSEPATNWFGADLVGARVRVRDTCKVMSCADVGASEPISGRMGLVTAMRKTWDCRRDTYLVNADVRLDPIPGKDETVYYLRAEDLEVLDPHEQNLSKAEDEWKPVESLEHLESLHGRVLRVALKPEAARLSGKLCVLLPNSDTEKHDGWALVRFLEASDNWSGGTRCNWRHLEFCSGIPASLRDRMPAVLREIGEGIQPDPPSMELDGVALASLANRLTGHCKRCGLTACSHPRTLRNPHR